MTPPWGSQGREQQDNFLQINQETWTRNISISYEFATYYMQFIHLICNINISLVYNTVYNLLEILILIICMREAVYILYGFRMRAGPHRPFTRPHN